MIDAGTRSTDLPPIGGIVFLVMTVWLAGCLARLPNDYPHWPPTEAPVTNDDGYLEYSERAFATADQQRVYQAERPLLLVPGVNNLPPAERLAFCQSLRRAGGKDLVCYYNWYAGHFGRDILLAWTTEAAARRLTELIIARHERHPDRPFAIFAHSGGTVVVLKAARLLAEAGEAAAFGNIVFTGTPIAEAAAMRSLTERCESLINVHSRFDLISRRLSDATDGFEALPDHGPHRNLAHDRGLSGQIIRHETFLQRDPELIQHWAAMLRHGRPPLPQEQGAGLATADHNLLHRQADWLAMHPPSDPYRLRQAILRLAEDPDPVRRCYAVTFAACTADHALLPIVRGLLQDPDSPPYLRRQIYRYFVALADGSHIDLLRYCRSHDQANLAATRDALRDLKRANVRAIRE